MLSSTTKAVRKKACVDLEGGDWPTANLVKRSSASLILLLFIIMILFFFIFI